VAGRPGERLAQAEPANTQWQHALAATYFRLGEVEMTAGQLAAARQAYEKALTIAERLAQAEPSNTQSQFALAGSHFRLATVARKQGNNMRAHAGFAKQLDIMVKLTALDPGNALWRKALLEGYQALLDMIPQKDCTADRHLNAAEATLAWFTQTKALDGDVEMPELRRYFQQYRARRSIGPCTNTVARQ
jgi:hypothetical protein